MMRLAPGPDPQIAHDVAEPGAGDDEGRFGIACHFDMPLPGRALVALHTRRGREGTPVYLMLPTVRLFLRITAAHCPKVIPSSRYICLISFRIRRSSGEGSSLRVLMMIGETASGASRGT
jgi:hypothetical protein